MFRDLHGEIFELLPIRKACTSGPMIFHKEIFDGQRVRMVETYVPHLRRNGECNLNVVIQSDIIHCTAHVAYKMGMQILQVAQACYDMPAKRAYQMPFN